MEVCTEAFTPDPDIDRIALVYRAFGLRPVRSQVSSLMFGPEFLAEPAQAPVLEERATRLRRSGRTGLRRALLGVAGRASVDGEISSITLPTLIAVGEHDRATPPANSQRLNSRISGSRLEVIAGSGHSTRLSNPLRSPR